MTDVKELFGLVVFGLALGITTLVLGPVIGTLVTIVGGIAILNHNNAWDWR